MAQDFDTWFDNLSVEEQKQFVEEMEADTYLASAENHEF